MSQSFRVMVTTTYRVTLNDNFRLTYTDNEGNERPRGKPKEIAADIAMRDSRPLSMMDGYADLPDDAVEVRETDFDYEVDEL